jgi:hypothetical protein
MFNDAFLRGGCSLIRSHIALVAYCVAAGFILAVAFHSASKMLVADDVPGVSDVK